MKPPPPIADAERHLEEALRRGKVTRDEVIDAGSITQIRYKELPGVIRTRRTVQGSRREVVTWTSLCLAGYSFASAADLLAAYRFARAHPHKPPPQAMSPKQLAGDSPAPRQDEGQPALL